MAIALGSALALALAWSITPNGMSDRDKWHVAAATLEQLHHDLINYRARHGYFPPDLVEVADGRWSENMIIDPFTNDPYRYDRTSTGFLLMSYGGDCEEGGSEIPELDIVFTESGQRLR